MAARGQGCGGMTAADPVEGDNTHDTTRLEELHALLDEFHEAARDQARDRGGDGVATIQMSHASAMVCKSWCQEGAGHADRWDRIDQRCFGVERPVRLSTESLGLWSDSTDQQYLAASLEQQADATAPRVSVGLNAGKGLLATLDEAQRFAYEILALVDQGRAQGWDPSLRRAAPEMIPLSRTLSGPVP